MPGEEGPADETQPVGDVPHEVDELVRGVRQGILEDIAAGEAPGGHRRLQAPCDRVAQFEDGSTVLSSDGAAAALAILETPLLVACCTALDRVLASCRRYDKENTGWVSVSAYRLALNAAGAGLHGRTQAEQLQRLTAAAGTALETAAISAGRSGSRTSNSSDRVRYAALDSRVRAALARALRAPPSAVPKAGAGLIASEVSWRAALGAVVEGELTEVQRWRAERLRGGKDSGKGAEDQSGEDLEEALALENAALRARLRLQSGGLSRAPGVAGSVSINRFPQSTLAPRSGGAALAGTVLDPDAPATAAPGPSTQHLIDRQLLLCHRQLAALTKRGAEVVVTERAAAARAEVLAAQQRSLELRDSELSSRESELAGRIASWEARASPEDLGLGKANERLQAELLAERARADAAEARLAEEAQRSGLLAKLLTDLRGAGASFGGLAGAAEALHTVAAERDEYYAALVRVEAACTRCTGDAGAEAVLCAVMEALGPAEVAESAGVGEVGKGAGQVADDAAAVTGLLIESSN